MELMKELLETSKHYCSGAGAGSSPGDVVGRRGAPGGSASGSERPSSKSAGGLAAALTPFGAALPLVQGVLGLAATTESVSPVRGTIEDQAFMNGVAMELRARNVSVLMPDTYMPFSLSEANTNSPFLISLNELLTLRACLIKELEKSEGTTPAVRQETETAREAIDVFLAGLMGTSLAPKQQTESHPDANAAEKKSSASGSFTPSHLISVLQADGLVQGLRSAQAWRHVLWLKALESGGSVTKTGNFLRTKTWYSGGAVGTYALFNVNGELECSGNVYAYAGPLKAKEFRKETLQTDFGSVVESCQAASQPGAAGTK
jgi:hypothetical protein